MADVEEVPLQAHDDQPIHARIFRPEKRVQAGLLIAPAMGVPQTYYEPLAHWLAGHGTLVATFDYRGIGLSRPRRLKGFKARITDWGERDAATVLEALARRAPDVPLHWLGHSVGGQILPYVPNLNRLTRIITVASGSGYWRENSPALRRRVWLLWYGVVPVVTPLAGYFPGQRLNMVGDLPKGVVKQWRRWCLHPDYAAGVEPDGRARFASVHTPITSLSFTDDEFMSARNIESLHGLYANAPCTMRRINPADAGVSRIGHFGFFRPEYEQALWARYLLPELEKAQPQAGEKIAQAGKSA